MYEVIERHKGLKGTMTADKGAEKEFKDTKITFASTDHFQERSRSDPTVDKRGSGRTG